MAKIIDTHSHILPGIDDGAGSWKEALCMLKTAQAQGIRRGSQLLTGEDLSVIPIRCRSENSVLHYRKKQDVTISV